MLDVLPSGDDGGRGRADARAISDDLLLDSAAALRIAERMVRDLGGDDAVDADDASVAAALQGVLLHVRPELVRLRDDVRRALNAPPDGTPAPPERSALLHLELLQDVEQRLASLVRLIGYLLPGPRPVTPPADRPLRP